MFVDGTPMVTSSIAYRDGSERQETFDEGLGMSVLGITRSGEGIVYLKTTSDKMPALDQETRTSFDDLPGAANITKTKVGAKTLNGMATSKFEIAATHDNGAIVTGHMWLQGDGVPIKVNFQAVLGDLMHTYHIEQTEIQVGPQPDELFAIP